MTILIFLAVLNLFAISIKDKIKSSGMQSLFTAFFAVNMLVYFGGAVNFLRPVTALCYILMVAVGIMHLVKCKDIKKSICEYFSISVVMANLSSVVFAFIYQVINPLCYYWDEYSFWSVSAKFVKYYDMFHSVAHSMVQFLNLPPVNTSMYYLRDFLAKDFSDAKLLCSYSVMFFICFGAMADYVQEKTGNRLLALGFFIFLLLSPFMATYHIPSARFTSLSYAYGTTMIDFNIAVVFGGVVAAYLSRRDRLNFLPALMFLALIKNTSIFFALLAGLVICCFILFEKDKKPFKRLTTMAIVMIIPVVAWASWALHTSVFLNFERSQSGYTLTEEIPRQFLAEEEKPEYVKREETSVLSIIMPGLRTERHQQVVNEMLYLIKVSSITSFGRDIFMAVILLLLGLSSLIFAGKDRFASALSVAGMFLGIFVYTLTISYFISFFMDGMVEYPRYMTSYYWSYIYVVLLIFVSAVGEKSKILSQLLVCALIIVSAKAVYDTRLDKTVIDPPRNPYALAEEADEILAPYRDVLTKGIQLYLVLPDMDTWGYYLYQQRALPAISNVGRDLPDINFTISFREHYDYENNLFHYNIATPELFSEIMNRYFDYILVIAPDKEFVDSYDSLFEGGIKTGSLYRITEDETPMKAVNCNG